jgi:5-deoxy-glucuronate isomerase
MQPETRPATAPGRGRPTRELHLQAGTAGADGDPIVVTPERAGWDHAGVRLLRLAAGETRTLTTGADELAVLPLAGACTVECDGRVLRLAGRDSVFDRVTDFAYVPMDAELRITSRGGGDVALPAARARRRLDVAYGAAEDVPVEIRGAGNCTRQITNFLAPDSFPADRLCAVEVLTPSGNWSSYPPHKHDEASDCEAILEEIYLFRVAGEQGFGAHRTYDLEQGWDVTVTVRNDDVFLVPRGYHGPSMAAPGYDLWYLNVLAGPGEERSMAFCDDPAHGWIRDSWTGVPTDPRVPMTGAGGRR